MPTGDSGNSEELRLKITPELDPAALKKAQDQLDALKTTTTVGGTGKGATKSNVDKQRESEFQKELARIKLLRDQEDVSLRKTRIAANEKIQILRQQAAAGKISMQQMNKDIITNEQTIETATSNSIKEYDKLDAQLENLINTYNDLEGASQKAVTVEKGILVARQRAATGFDSMSGSMQNMVSQTKNANLAFMNFGRIVQDAPFGLIGISNNIDPLLMSFRQLSTEIDVNTGKVRGATGAFLAMGRQLLGPAGIIFLLGSALPTALLFLQKRQQQQSSATEEATSQAVEFASKVLEMKSKVELATIGFIDQDKVVKEFNETLAKNAGVAKDIGEINDKLTQNTPKIVEAMVLRAQAQVLINQAAQEYVDITTGKEQEKSWSERIDFEKRVNAIVAKRIDLSNILSFAQIKEIDSQARIQVEEEIALERKNKLVSTQDQITELLIQSSNLTKDINVEDDKKLKYYDKSIVEQTKLSILAEKQFEISNDETKTWEERLRAVEKGVFYQRSSLELQLKSLEDERNQSKEIEDQLQLDSQILIKRNEIAKTDQIIFDFQKKMSDARVDELVQRAQMLQLLEDEAKKYEDIPAGEIDTGDKLFDARLKDASDFINTVSDLEIEKAIFTGNKLKALFLERKRFEDNQTQYYLDLGYERTVARQMAEQDAAKLFALREKQIKIDSQTEIFQAVGELASASVDMIFGESKNGAVAQVVIDTIMGIQKIWSQTGMDPIVGALKSAALAAKGIAAISKIKSTTTKSSSVTGDTRGAPTTREVMIEGVGSRQGQRLTPNGTVMSTSAQPFTQDMSQSINIDAKVDRRGLAIAVREGEREIRTSEFSYI